jgi:glucosamine--fructose-6-phosphate aminotransferase (isomerizing)
MEDMLHEILAIPQTAWVCYENCQSLILPSAVPYLGMGSSYYAPLVLRYCGKEIHPEVASEYFNYISPGKTKPLGVLISQSGESSETLWCRDLFKEFIAITNESQSELARSKNAKEVILLNAGREGFSSTKTYINTLVILYNGFGIDIKNALENIYASLEMYREWGEKTAFELAEYIRKEKINGIYFTGSGPNFATSCQSALIFTETTKLTATSQPLSQYDHGPKESAPGSLVFMLQAEGSSKSRTEQLAEKLTFAGAQVIPVVELSLPEILSPFPLIIRTNFLSYYLARELGISRTFNVGGKITRVEL